MTYFRVWSEHGLYHRQVGNVMSHNLSGAILHNFGGEIFSQIMTRPSSPAYRPPMTGQDITPFWPLVTANVSVFWWCCGAPGQDYTSWRHPGEKQNLHLHCPHCSWIFTAAPCWPLVRIVTLCPLSHLLNLFLLIDPVKLWQLGGFCLCCREQHWWGPIPSFS